MSIGWGSLRNYLFEPRVLERLLTEARMRNETDFGRDVFPRLQGCERFYAYDFTTNIVPGDSTQKARGYWRDVGSLDSLAQTRKDILGVRPKFHLQSVEWPIHSTGERLVRSPTKIGKGQPVGQGVERSC